MANQKKADKQLIHEQVQWKKNTFPLTIACDNWQNPRNVGMAFRLAEAFGVQSLWLGGTTPVPPNQKISKTSRSAVRNVPYRYQANLKEALLTAQDNGQALIGVEITSHSQKISSLARIYRNKPSILVLGSEKEGISAELLAILDACGHIPMYGANSSLNVATALAIGLYAWTEEADV